MDTKQGWWVVFGAALTLTITAGVGFFSIPVLTDAIRNEMGWTLKEFSYGTSIWAVSGGLYCFVCGVLIERFGVRIVMLSGIVLGAAIQYSMGHVHTLAQFYFVMSLAPISILSCTHIPIATLITHWFVEHRGKATGLAMLGIGIGGGIAPKLTAAFMEAHGWRGAMGNLSFVLLLALIPAFIWLRSPKGHATPEEELSHADASPEIESSLSLKEAIRTRTFWNLSLGDMFFGAVFTTFNLHLVIYLTHDMGDEALARNILSTYLLCMSFGTLFFGWLGDVLPFRRVLISTYFLPALAILFLLLPPHPVLLYTFAILTGLGGGGRIALIPVALANNLGQVHIAKIFGFSNTLFMVGNAVGPIIAASIFDSTGNTHYIYMMCIALLCLSSALVSTLRNERFFSTNSTDR